MTKEEFMIKLKESNIDLEVFVNLTQFSKATIYTWVTGRMKAPGYVETILNLLISLRLKFLLFNINENFFKNREIKSIQEEVNYYKKVIALKKENDKLRKKIESLKAEILA